MCHQWSVSTTHFLDWKEEGRRGGILGSPSREWSGCGWACGSMPWKWRLGLITTCLGRAGQHRREKDDQEGAEKKKLQVLQGLRGSLRRWREGRTSKKCKTTKLMGPLVRAGPCLWPWKEERKLETKGKVLSFHINVRRNSLLRVCWGLTLARHQSFQAECIRIKKELSTF